MNTVKFKVGSRVIIARPEANQEQKGRLALVVASRQRCLTEDQRWVKGYIIYVDGYGNKPFVAPGCELDPADEDIAA